MNGKLTHESIKAAKLDLENRTLAKIEGDFARLIYLASLRDYNTGEYHHEGLAQRHTSKFACDAIASCHREIFERLVLRSVKELVDELETYARANCADNSELVKTWKKLQPYRVTVPLDCSSFTKDFFEMNVRVALEILSSPGSPTE